MSEIEKTQSPITNDNTDAAKVPMDLRLRGALVRTAISSEQTLMSWTRTSVSLLAFGFSIAQFFQYLAKRGGDSQISTGPRRMGIALICVGMLALVLAMVEHVHCLRTLQAQGLPRISHYLLPLGSAVVLFAIGIAALVLS